MIVRGPTGRDAAIPRQAVSRRFSQDFNIFRRELIENTARLAYRSAYQEGLVPVAVGAVPIVHPCARLCERKVFMHALHHVRRLTIHRALWLAVLSLSILLSTLVAAQDASYTYTTFDVPDVTAHTSAYGINNAGQVVGTFSNATGPHGFLKDGATFTTIDVPGAAHTVAFGINNAGQIVGRITDATGALAQGFLKDGATFTPIDVPGATRGTQAYGINNAGQIVGLFIDATGHSHGFLATPAGADVTPPVITVTASPATPSPPNGKLITVTVSGTITEDEPDDSGVQAGSTIYKVIDEYEQIQPKGSFTLDAGGGYTFTVKLQASKNGDDKDGRHYTIEVSATDNAGNTDTESAIVTVPRK
jgi:probable HAF family extracellular repeat protein